MSKTSTILLGYEVGDTGASVEIPLKHLAITGQTQEAGKTTALEALIARSGLRAVTFITKRGEASFVGARRIDPYFREQADWQFVASILEASRGEKLKFERAWIIRASRGAKTLADVQANVRTAMEKARGMSADVYLTLDAYLDVVVPEIAKVEWAPGVDLRAGVNAVDLTDLSIEMQHLVIRSTISWVLNREENTVVVVPEAWKFIPQGRGTPVKLAAEAFIRQAAAMGNYLWLDSQDLGGIDKQILRSVAVWILGVQREINEIKRTLDNIPAGMKKPKPADIATLELGQFYACWGKHAIKTYVQPAWMPNRVAMQVAAGEVPIEVATVAHMPLPKEGIRKFQDRLHIPESRVHRLVEHVVDQLENELRERPQKEPPPHTALEPKSKFKPPESPTAMSFDQQLAEANHRADKLRDAMKWAIKELGYSDAAPWPAADDEGIEFFKGFIKATVHKIKTYLPDPKASPGTVQTGPVNINAIEREVAITFSQETRTFETTGCKGRIMFALVHELKRPAREKEIIDAMKERGWHHIRQSVAPELSKLVKAGDLIRDETESTYRLPGKLKLTIDGKKV